MGDAPEKNGEHSSPSGGAGRPDNGPATEERTIDPTTINRAIRELMASMEDIDKKVASPEMRARKVWKHLDKDNLSVWDLACFCVETLGYLLPVYPHMEAAVKRVNIELYQTHYANWEQIASWEEQPLKSPIITI